VFPVARARCLLTDHLSPWPAVEGAARRRRVAQQPGPSSHYHIRAARVWETRQGTPLELGNVQTRDSGDAQGFSLQLQRERLLPNQSHHDFLRGCSGAPGSASMHWGHDSGI